MEVILSLKPQNVTYSDRVPKPPTRANHEQLQETWDLIGLKKWNNNL